ncbi:MAG: hypothetical protein VX624_18520, partial [Pseudomonadota bacterium]|nr:hypothetical protein [Pseudomonadota bacterium]
IGAAVGRGSGPRTGSFEESLRRGTLDAEWEHNVYAQLMQVFGGDFGEAVRAFREKRQPKFG